MTGGKFADYTYLFKSDLLYNLATDATSNGYTGAVRRYVLTNGMNLINPGVSITSNNWYKLSFDQLIKTLNVFLGIGVGIEIDDATGKDCLRIEEKSYFFDTTAEKIELGEVANFTNYFDKGFSAGKIRIGWPGGIDDPDVVLYEPNAVSEWQLPNRNNSNELDLVSSIRADGTEITRIIADADDTTTMELFLLELKEDSGEYKFLNDTDGVITTDTPPTNFTVYNGTLTPRNCMRVHLPFISSINWNFTSKAIEFLNGENQLANMGIKLFSEGSYTNESDSITPTAPVYFYPIIFDIDSYISNDVIDLLNANPNRKIGFSYNGNNYEGWILEVNIDFYGKSETKFKLIACTGFDNIIYNFIR
jgi:hypothetical protein